MATKPVLIGITGGIGAGKSLVRRIFEALGYPAYDADQRAKWLLDQDRALRQALIEKFGSEAYTPQGSYNAGYFRQRAFAEPAVLHHLNALIHPAVGRDFSAWVEHHAQATYLFKEAALLIETGSYRELDRLITVEAPEELRLHRVLQRDPFRHPEQVRQIMARQLSPQERMAQADFVLINDEKQPLLPQVLEVL